MKIVGMFYLTWCKDRIVMVNIKDFYQVHVQKRDERGVWKSFATSPDLQLVDAKARFAQVITMGLFKHEE